MANICLDFLRLSVFFCWPRRTRLVVFQSNIYEHFFGDFLYCLYIPGSHKLNAQHTACREFSSGCSLNILDIVSPNQIILDKIIITVMTHDQLFYITILKHKKRLAIVWARKLKKVLAKKLVNIATNFFFVKLHFYQF